jgi:hypothetical protein
LDEAKVELTDQGYAMLIKLIQTEKLRAPPGCIDPRKRDGRIALMKEDPKLYSDVQKYYDDNFKAYWNC